MKVVECLGRFLIFYTQLEMYYGYSFETRAEAERKLRSLRTTGVRRETFKRYSEVVSEPAGSFA